MGVRNGSKGTEGVGREGGEERRGRTMKGRREN